MRIDWTKYKRWLVLDNQWERITSFSDIKEIYINDKTEIIIQLK